MTSLEISLLKESIVAKFEIDERKTYVEEAMERIVSSAKSANTELSGFVCTAIFVELKNMYNVGISQAKQEIVELLRSDIGCYKWGV